MYEKKYLIIYHKEDNDGIFSAAIMYQYLIKRMGLTLEDLCFLGSTYAELDVFAERNDVKELHNRFSNIIMVDISFNNVKYMKSLYKEFDNNFVWCDHHAPIIKESFKNNFDGIPGIRDTKRSAILCTYKYLYDPFDELYNKKEIPELYRILSAWDSWTYKQEGYEFEYVQKINKGITYKYNLELSKVYEFINDKNFEFIDTYIDSIYKIGDLIVDVEDKKNEENVKNNGDFTWLIEVPGGEIRKACALFIQGGSSSTIFKSIKDIDPTINNGIVFKRNNNGTWVISMYNIYNEDTFHCGDFLKLKYKGGGHVGAAGATISESKFIKILKSKKI